MATISEALAIAREHHRSGRLELAEEIYRRILAVEPDQPEALHLSGAVAHQRGRHVQAIEYVQRAIGVDGGQARYHNTLGEAYRALGRFAEAVECYDRAIAINPNHAGCCNNLGLACEALGKLDEAIAWYGRALALAPRLAEPYNNLGNALQDQGDVQRALGCYRQALALSPDRNEFHSNYLYALRYQPDVTPRALLEAHREFDRRHAARWRTAWQAHPNTPDPQRPLSLGFVSHVSRRPFGNFLLRGLEHLDRGQWRIACYWNVSADDEAAARCRALASTWLCVSATSDDQLAARIRQDGIDILFDLAGHAAGRRLLVFARKPAPVQITWLDCVGTTGLSAMDYLLADRHLVPPEAEPYYAERVLRMPDGYVCYDPLIETPPVGPLPAQQHGHVRFGSFNRAAKIHPGVVQAWARILSGATGSRLLLKNWEIGAHAGDHYRRLFAACGVDPARIEFEGHSPLGEYFDAYNRIDIALDPFPHNGGLTSCDSLWMGVPVVTCPGETFASRQSLSHLSAIGLTETIAGDVDQYVEIAVGLANDLPRLAAIRAGLRRRVAESPLCDGKRFARQLTTILRDVWRTWCAKPT